MTLQHPLELLVRNLELRSTLSLASRKAIFDLPHTLKTLEPASYLLREGDKPRKCGVLVSGFAYRQKSNRVGTRQIVAICVPGEAVDFQTLFLPIADHSVQMLTRGKVASIYHEDLQALVRSNSEINEAVFIKTLVEASIFREWVVNLGRRTATQKIAHFLCELGLRLDAMGLADQYGYVLPMTQETLADTVGMTPVHTNRSLKTLSAEGLISREKGKVNFSDWHKLRETADFSERYLHLNHQPSDTA